MMLAITATALGITVAVIPAMVLWTVPAVAVPVVWPVVVRAVMMPATGH